MIHLVGLTKEKAGKRGGWSFPLEHTINHSPKLEGKVGKKCVLWNLLFYPFF